MPLTEIDRAVLLPALTKLIETAVSLAPASCRASVTVRSPMLLAVLTDAAPAAASTPLPSPSTKAPE